MNSFWRVAIAGLLFWCSVGAMRGETGREAWLRYAPLTNLERAKYVTLPASTVAIGDSELIRNAQKELVHGFRGMMGRTLREGKAFPQENALSSELSKTSTL